MSLSGLPLILLTAALTLAAAAATVRGWKLSGRKWMPLRVAALTTVEILLVAGIGLVVNRQEGFYPSWQALGGSEQVATTAPPTAGRLDGTLDTDRAIAWSPPQVGSWHLAAAPLLVAPAQYDKSPDRTFPVVVVLTTPSGAAEVRKVAASATDVLTVVLQPTHATAAASLIRMRVRLGEDTRTADSLVVLADPAWKSLAARWPGHPLVIDGHTAAAFDAAARELPPPLAAAQKLPS